MPPATRQTWKDRPEDHDYLAAEAYLDPLRASRLPPLPSANFHVALDLQKVKTGKPLSPVLLVRGDLASEIRRTVADGYHRLCASHFLDEDGDIPCRIAELGRR
jgi:hypothetical protein